MLTGKHGGYEVRVYDVVEFLLRCSLEERGL